MANKTKKNENISLFRSFMPALIGVGAIGLAVVVQLAIPAYPVNSQTAAIKKGHKVATAISKITSTPSTATSSTKVTTPSAISQKSVVAVSKTSGVKPEPVVVPSPSSNVSGLTPSTPVTTPSSSGSGGSSTPPSSSSKTTSYSSYNWSGYMASSSSFNAISGSWIAPDAIGVGSSTSADSTWIGIGGVTSGDLIQVGTEDIINPSGQVTTSAFYELLPSYSQTVPGVTVRPGDSITASLNETTSSLWAISITDNTNGQSYNTTLSYNSSNSSAEWIEEDPSYSIHQQIPFDNFQTVSFTSATTTTSGIDSNLSTSSALPITMVNVSGQNISTPSTIGSNNESFIVTRNNLP